MQLFEFFEQLDQDRYSNQQDKSVYDIKDTRKSRLTLEMINQLRMHMQARREEKQSAQVMYQKMYGGSVADASELA